MADNHPPAGLRSIAKNMTSLRFLHLIESTSARVKTWFKELKFIPMLMWLQYRLLIYFLQNLLVVTCRMYVGWLTLLVL